MKAFFSKIGLLVFVLSVVVLPYSAQAATPMANTRDYDYQVVSQSAYPIMQPGEETILWVKLKNTGRKSWSRDTVRLGTANPLDGQIVFGPNDYDENPEYKPNWISKNRIRMDQATVAPGQIADFGFYIRVPNNPTNYGGNWKFYFRPVVDGTGWMKDAGIYWDVTINDANTPTPPCAQVITRAKDPATGEVRDFPTPCSVPSLWTKVDNNTPITPARNYNTSGTYRYQFVDQSAHSNMMIGDKKKLSIRIKNTGTATWYKDGPNPVRLATSHDQDRWSPFYDSTWVADNRAANLTESIVSPGQIGTFEFIVYAPLANSNSFIPEDSYRCTGAIPENESVVDEINRSIDVSLGCSYVDGPVREYFQPVVEGKQWMQDIGIYWDITVKNDFIDALYAIQIEDFITEATVEKLMADAEAANYDSLITFALENIDLRSKTDISDVINAVANCSAITKTVPTQTAIGLLGISLHGNTTLSMSNTLYSTDPDSCVVNIKNGSVGQISLDTKARAILANKGLPADRIQVLEREINSAITTAQQDMDSADISINCVIKKNDLTTILKDVNGQRLSFMERLNFAKRLIFGQPPIANCQPVFPPDFMDQVAPQANIMSAKISQILN